MARPSMGRRPKISKSPITVRRTITVDIPVAGLSEQLYKAQKESSLSIVEAMRMVNMTQSTWSQYVSGNTPVIRVELLMALESILECDFGLDWSQWIPESIGPKPKRIITPYWRED